MENVLIIGASNKPERYSYQAMQLLTEHGHQVTLNHPSLTKINDFNVVNNLAEIKNSPDTITMYVNPKLSANLLPELIRLKPKRIIFNPGTENNQIYDELHTNNIKTEEACTLILLRTNKY